jgi:hypothetical protein
MKLLIMQLSIIFRPRNIILDEIATENYYGLRT